MDEAERRVIFPLLGPDRFRAGYGRRRPVVAGDRS